MDKADNLSRAKVGRDWPTGLLAAAEGRVWYLEVVLFCGCRLQKDGLFSSGV